jgi:hypothetical protein
MSARHGANERKRQANWMLCRRFQKTKEMESMGMVVNLTGEVKREETVA